jgi:hypothetical protein
MTSPPPTDPLTSAAVVAGQLSLDAGNAEVLERLGATIAAVNELVPRMATTPRSAQTLGAMMLAARLYRRRNSPEGVATFTSDGAVYVQRNDPDVAMLLGLGSYAPPVVG